MKPSTIPSLLQFTPVLKRIRWGGRRLETDLGKTLGDGDDFAESWEISAHENGVSILDGGPLDGMTLPELARRYPDELLGPHRRSDVFPLLVKFLDAHDRLSVQVHPNDEQAARYQPGENGKTEAWVILTAEPGSRLYTGLKTGVDRETLLAAINNGTLEDCLHSITVSAGDCVFLPAGTVHAIGEGILLAEIQQSSNLTFRLYDWGRVGADGQPRLLHIQEALACIDFDRGPVSPVTPTILSGAESKSERLVQCPYFEIQRHTSSTPFRLAPRETFQVVMMLRGAADISTQSERAAVSRGGTILIPACETEVAITPTGPENVILLEAFVPEMLP